MNLCIQIWRKVGFCWKKCFSQIFRDMAVWSLQRNTDLGNLSAYLTASLWHQTKTSSLQSLPPQNPEKIGYSEIACLFVWRLTSVNGFLKNITAKRKLLWKNNIESDSMRFNKILVSTSVKSICGSGFAEILYFPTRMSEKREERN